MEEDRHAQGEDGEVEDGEEETETVPSGECQVRTPDDLQLKTEINSINEKYYAIEETINDINKEVTQEKQELVKLTRLSTERESKIRILENKRDQLKHEQSILLDERKAKENEIQRYKSSKHKTSLPSSSRQHLPTLLRHGKQSEHHGQKTVTEETNEISFGNATDDSFRPNQEQNNQPRNESTRSAPGSSGNYPNKATPRNNRDDINCGTTASYGSQFNRRYYESRSNWGNHHRYKDRPYGNHKNHFNNAPMNNGNSDFRGRRMGNNSQTNNHSYHRRWDSNEASE